MTYNIRTNIRVGDRLKNSGILTDEESNAARDSIILRYLLDICQNQREKVEIDLPLPSLCLDMTDALMSRIHDDLSDCRKLLRAANIKVIELSHERAYLHYQFICRGYESKFNFMREYLKAELSVRLGKYVDQMVKDLKALRKA